MNVHLSLPKPYTIHHEFTIIIWPSFTTQFSIFFFARNIADAIGHFVYDDMVQLTSTTAVRREYVNQYNYTSGSRAAINRTDFENSFEHWFMVCVIFLSKCVANLWHVWCARRLHINQNQIHTTHSQHFTWFFQFKLQFWSGKVLIVSFSPLFNILFSIFGVQRVKKAKSIVRESGLRWCHPPSFSSITISRFCGNGRWLCVRVEVCGSNGSQWFVLRLNEM